MKYIPILFSTPMVRAIISGLKNQTRRVIKIQPTDEWMENTRQFSPNGYMYDEKGKQLFWLSNPNQGKNEEIKCPYGKPGDILWVRETWQHSEFGFLYRAEDDYSKGFKWKPSIFMPKKACRTFLKIKNIRVERLQDITEQDAINEGIERVNDNEFLAYRSYVLPKERCLGVFPIVSFQTLWQKINGVSSWVKNPWVWVIDFERIEKPKNFI